MAWWALAAAAAPVVMDMFTDKPDMPGYQRINPQLPDRSGYQNQMLDMAFDPQSGQYQLASDAAADNVNRLLARSGMRGSSVGGQLMASTQAELANQWLAEQVQRQSQALNSVQNYDLERERLALGASDAAYNRAMGEYQMAMNQRAANIKGISGIAQAGMNAYGQSQAASSYGHLHNSPTVNLYNQQPTMQYGTPYYTDSMQFQTFQPNGSYGYGR